MLSSIYIAGFAITTISLIFWYYFKNNKVVSKLMSAGFFVGAAIYGVAVFMQDGELTNKMIIVARDLCILGATGYIFGMLAKNKIVFFAFLALLFAAFQYKWKPVMLESFSYTAPSQMDLSSGSNVKLAQEGELLIKLDNLDDFDQVSSSLAEMGLFLDYAFEPADDQMTELDNYFLIDIPNNYNSSDLAKLNSILSEDPAIELIEGNETVQIDPMEMAVSPSKDSPVDLRKFGLNDPSLKDLWGFQEMNVDQLYKYVAHNKIKPKRKARVFILDTGVDGNHEDLKANYRSLKSKYDKDPMGHGTHCAGIAGAVSNNKIGVASFSQNNEFVEITSITVLSSFGGGTQAGIIKGMIEAADAGADVISMSLGGRSNDRSQKAYQEAVEYCNKKGAIVVVAAGNSNADAKLFAPANAPGAITVSALGPDLNRAAFSNFIQNVDYGIAAPGVNIFSTTPKNQYASFNGTSMATPYVAGLVGVMKSINPKLTTREVYDILKKTGNETGNTKETGRFIQPMKAVRNIQ